SRIIWCAATTMRISYYSFGTPRVSSTTRLEFGEDLVGVLTESRCGRTGLPWRAMEIRRRRHHWAAADSIRHEHHAARGVELLVGHHVLDGVDRRPEELRFCRKDFRPFDERPRREDRVQLADESCRVDRAGVCRFVAGIGQPVRPFDGPAQRRPRTIALQPDDPEP